MSDPRSQPTIRLGADSMPALGLGTWQLEGEACETAVRLALDLGYRHLDTAQIYGNEAEVGRALEASDVDRQDVFLTTKIWNSNLAPQPLLESFAASLDRLRTAWVDLLLIHWPHAGVPLDETLGAMRQLQTAGSARQLGVSNFPPSWIERARSHADVVCNQVEYHPYLGQSALIETLGRHDMVLTAYSPLARGEVQSDPTLREIGERHGKTAAQVALRWLIQQPRVAAIPKASSAEHLASNAAIFDFTLSDAEMEQIRGLDRDDRKIQPKFAPDWER
ncbi:MAG: aldo/keto reductase [Acidobacteriota bacterium]